MITPRKFKTSLFGYKKKLVNAYIMECAQNSEKTKTELEAKNKELEAKVFELTEKNAVLEKERAYIADALLNAKSEAEKMISEARLETQKMRSGIELELEELRSKVRAEKTYIDDIKAKAKNTLEEYINHLADINIETDADDSDNAEDTEEQENSEDADGQEGETQYQTDDNEPSLEIPSEEIWS